MAVGTVPTKTKPTLPAVCGGGVQSKTRGEESMKVFTVYKAGRIGKDEVEDVTIFIHRECPDVLNIEIAEQMHTENAEKVVEALLSALPQGTTDRVIGLLMQRRATLFLAPMFKAE